MLSGAQLSPDGWRIALRSAGPDGHTRLAVMELKTREPTVVASFDGAGIAHFEWVNDRRLVFSMRAGLGSSRRVEFAPGLFAVDADGKRFRQLVQTTGMLHGSGRELLHWSTRLVQSQPGRRGDHVYVTRPQEVSKEKTDYFVLHRLDTVTGRAREIDVPKHSVSWTFDHAGEPRLASTREAGEVALHLRSPEGTWREISRRPWLSSEGIVPRSIGPDGTIYVEALYGDKTAVFTLDPVTGKRSELPLVASKAFDLNPGFVATRERLLGLRYVVDAEVTQWFDADAQTLQERVDKLLPGRVNRLSLPQHGDSPWVLVQSWSDRQPLQARAYHRDSGQWLHLGGSHPEIVAQAMGSTEFLRYTARDGLEIPAYLTLPPGGGRKLPLLVWVHGGPWLRGASWRWDPEIQFLATRGYAVLQPEFRGSTGFGARHFEAGFRQWGRAMQDDLTDGARWAVAQGVADPRRICILGASYGGYATLMGLIREPELFRCGVQWVGVSDPGMMFSVSWSDVTESSKRHGFAKLIGDPVADAEMLRAVSPLALAARLKQPLLMAYGEFDARVPIVHGEKLRDALEPHNPKVEWVVYEGEGHGWSQPETRIDFWSRVEKFLQRELAPR